MSNLKIDTMEQLEAALDKNRDLIIGGRLDITINVTLQTSVRNICVIGDISANGDICVIGDISSRGDISACNIGARHIHASDIYARHIHARHISALDIHASDIHASDIHARHIHARHISSRGDISALDIGACNIGASGFIKCHTIKTASIYAVAFGTTLTCHGIYPAAGPADRQQWAERFGIGTSTGCYVEWHERLGKVAKKLLKKKHWLPIERQMLLSVTGFHENGGAA